MKMVCSILSSEFVLGFPSWYSVMTFLRSDFRICTLLSITGFSLLVLRNEISTFRFQNLYSVFHYWYSILWSPCIHLSEFVLRFSKEFMLSFFLTSTLLQNYYIQINDIVLSLYLDLDLCLEFHYWYSGNQYIQMS